MEENTKTVCRYYNTGNSLGIVGIPLDKIKHSDGEYTFLVNRQADYQWIRTVDLHDTYEKAEMAKVASFL